MTTTKLFKSSNSQAVLLPKDVAFPEGVEKVVIFCDGARRVLVPAHVSWEGFFDAPAIDLAKREQPKIQLRG